MITCLAKHWSHHTSSGGYDRLAQAVGAGVVDRPDLHGIFGRAAQKVWRWQTKTSSYLVDYQFGDLLAEMKILGKSQLSPPDLVHVLYGDEQLNQLLQWRRFLRSRLIVSFHLPGDRAADRFRTFQPGLRHGIDAAIVLATNQLEPFKALLGAEKVVYVPHGIDTDRFRPMNRNPSRIRFMVLIVGEHMRDWTLMHRLIDEANYQRLPIDFHVVAWESRLANFTGCDNLFFHSQISESELIRLYCEADVLFVPVIDATANNSVLEALACGTPVISTKIGGIPDYVSDESGWLFQRGEMEPVLDLIKRMCADRKIASSRRNAARIQALKFDWHEIARQMLILYSTVLAGLAPSDAVKEFDAKQDDVASLSLSGDSDFPSHPLTGNE